MRDEVSMKKPVTIGVDGKALRVEEGALLIDVLLKHGIAIPHFCYHEALGADGNCRMCMVEIKGAKRPQIACNTFVKAGMEVSTTSESIQQVKRNILELELVNHPVDCPVCDQAGECRLQDYYMDFGLYQSRLGTQKTRKGKAIDLGRNVMLDQERCVLCARCTRFTQEITKTHELAIVGRGDQARVSTAPGRKLDNPYAMNVVDLCPVGALTSRDFRFRQRVWFLDSVAGICHGCAKGCNIWIDHNAPKYEQDRIYRFRPRVNHAVNGHFLCDEGRLSYKEQNSSRSEELYAYGETIAPEAALTSLRELLATHKRIVAIADASLSLEQLAAVTGFCEKNAVELFSLPEYDGEFGDGWLRRNDRSANSAAVKTLGICTDETACRTALKHASLVFNFNHPALLAGQQPDIADKMLVQFATKPFESEERSALIFPFADYAMDEGTLINCDLHLQRFRRSLKQESPSATLLEWLHRIDDSLPANAQTAWETILTRYPQFSGITYGAIGPSGMRLKGADDA